MASIAGDANAHQTGLSLACGDLKLTYTPRWEREDETNLWYSTVTKTLQRSQNLEDEADEFVSRTALWKETVTAVSY